MEFRFLEPQPFPPKENALVFGGSGKTPSSPIMEADRRLLEDSFPVEKKTGNTKAFGICRSRGYVGDMSLSSILLKPPGTKIQTFLVVVDSLENNNKNRKDT